MLVNLARPGYNEEKLPNYGTGTMKLSLTFCAIEKRQSLEISGFNCVYLKDCSFQI